MTECLLNKKLVLIILSALELCLSENGAKQKSGYSDCNIFLSIHWHMSFFLSIGSKPFVYFFSVKKKFWLDKNIFFEHFTLKSIQKTRKKHQQKTPKKQQKTTKKPQQMFY